MYLTFTCSVSVYRMLSPRRPGLHRFRIRMKGRIALEIKDKALKDEFLASAIFYSGTLADEKHHIICFDSNVS